MISDLEKDMISLIPPKVNEYVMSLLDAAAVMSKSSALVSGFLMDSLLSFLYQVVRQERV